jgi:hypothetical protein
MAKQIFVNIRIHVPAYKLLTLLTNLLLSTIIILLLEKEI